MRGTNHGGRDAKAWRMARRQQGVVARRDLLRLGFSSREIERRIGRGRLHPVARGVYSVGRRDLSPRGRWMAAVLSCGAGACLSHRSAGALYGINEERPGRIDVSVPRAGKVERPGIRVRSRPALSGREIGTLDGIPVTSPVRTLIDLAVELPTRHLLRAVNEADKLDAISVETLRAELECHTGQPGVKRLVALIDRDTFVLTEEELERLFLPMAREAGLPLPETGVMVNGYEVDFFWPDLRLVIETDGLRYHRTPSAQAKDARRDQAHTAAGFARLRFTHWQVKHEPTYVKRILAEVVNHAR